MIKASYFERIVRKAQDLRPYLFKVMTAWLPAFFCGTKTNKFYYKKTYFLKRRKRKCQNVPLSLSYYFYLP